MLPPKPTSLPPTPFQTLEPARFARRGHAPITTLPIPFGTEQVNYAGQAWLTVPTLQMGQVYGGLNGSGARQANTVPGNSPFLGSQLSRKVNFSGKSNFLGSHVSREITFHEKSPFTGSHLSREVAFPGKSHFPRSHLSQEVIFPGKSYTILATAHASVPSHVLPIVFREVSFPGKSAFPGNQLSKEVTFPGKAPFPGSNISREVT